MTWDEQMKELEERMREAAEQVLSQQSYYYFNGQDAFRFWGSVGTKITPREVRKAKGRLEDYIEKHGANIADMHGAEEAAIITFGMTKMDTPEKRKKLYLDERIKIFGFLVNEYVRRNSTP